MCIPRPQTVLASLRNCGRGMYTPALNNQRFGHVHARPQQPALRKRRGRGVRRRAKLVRCFAPPSIRYAELRARYACARPIAFGHGKRRRRQVRRGGQDWCGASHRPVYASSSNSPRFAAELRAACTRPPSTTSASQTARTGCAEAGKVGAVLRTAY